MDNPAANDSWQKLAQGNARFLSGKPLGSLQSSRRIGSLSAGQNPYAAVICCSDSRCAPEVIFDTALGDIFVIRAAGQLLDRAGAGSLEYAAAHLKVPLVVVVGHTGCGMVAAAQDPDGLEPNLTWMAEKVGASLGPYEEGRVADNVRAGLLRCREILRPLGVAPKLVGALLDLDTGRVGLL